MLKTTTKILTLAAMMGAASFAAMPASAGTGAAVSVTIDRADLMSEQGTTRVYYRLKKTAEDACQADDGRVSAKQAYVADQCAARLMDGFVAQLNSQRMTALHAEVKSLAG